MALLLLLILPPLVMLASVVWLIVTGPVLHRLGWDQAAAACALVTAAAYATGLWDGGLLSFRSSSEVCGAQVTRSPSTTFWPLSHVCYTDEGTFDLVAPAFNVWLTVGAAGFVCFGLVAMVQRRRPRREDASAGQAHRAARFGALFHWSNGTGSDDVL